MNFTFDIINEIMPLKISTVMMVVLILNDHVDIQQR